MNVKNTLFLLLAFGMMPGVWGMGRVDSGMHDKPIEYRYNQELARASTQINTLLEKAKTEIKENDIKAVQQWPKLSLVQKARLVEQNAQPTSDLYDWKIEYTKNGEDLQETGPFNQAPTVNVGTSDGTSQRQNEITLPQGSVLKSKTKLGLWAGNSWNAESNLNKHKTAIPLLLRWTRLMWGGLAGTLLSATAGIFAKSWQKIALPCGAVFGALALISFIKQRPARKHINTTCNKFIENICKKNTRLLDGYSTESSYELGIISELTKSVEAIQKTHKDYNDFCTQYMQVQIDVYDNCKTPANERNLSKLPALTDTTPIATKAQNKINELKNHVALCTAISPKEKQTSTFQVISK